MTALTVDVCGELLISQFTTRDFVHIFVCFFSDSFCKVCCALVHLRAALSVVLKLFPTPPSGFELKDITGLISPKAAKHKYQQLKGLNMLTHLLTIICTLYFVCLSHQVCVDVPSETQAVLGLSMKLTCIDCMKREEVKAKTRVDWYYMPNETSGRIHIYKYREGTPIELDSRLKGRLLWNGSQDLQDLSIRIQNVSFDDSGFYTCEVHREFHFDYFTPTASTIKNIPLMVIEKASEDPTALYSEIMMYVLLVFLTFWLLVEMVYCYRKISKSDEQAQDTATNYLAIPSEQKDSTAAPVTE